MRYILKEVGKQPQVCSAGPGGLSLKETQALVGGYIEAVNICLPQVNAICNEDGMYAGPVGSPLAANWCGLLGNFLVMAYDEDGNQRDLTDQEFLWVGIWMGQNWRMKHPIHDPINEGMG